MIKKLIFLPFLSLILLASSIAMADTTITVPDNYPKVVASGTINYANNIYSVDSNSYNISSVLPITTGEVYVTFTKPLPTNHPIVIVSPDQPIGSVPSISSQIISDKEIAVSMKATTAGNLTDIAFHIIVYAPISKK